MAKPSTKRTAAKSAKRTARASTPSLVKPQGGGPLLGTVFDDVLAKDSRGGYRRHVTRDEALDAELATINAILSEAQYGRTARLIDLYKSTRARDSRLGAVCRTRTLAIASRPFVIKPAPGYETDAEGVAVADRVRRIFQETASVKKAIATLSHGVLEGFAVAEHQWRANARGEWVSEPVWRHSNRFAWDIDTAEICKSDQGFDSFPGTPLSEWPGKFIVHTPTAGEADYPWHRGAMRARAVASVVKRLGIRWWLKLLERWGQPQVFATNPDSFNDNVHDLVMEALRNLSSAWHARFPEGTKIEAIPVTVDKDIHNTWVQFHATEDAIAILGQNLSTEVTGGSFAAAMAQQRVRLDILAADLSELSETLRDQWIRWLVHYNWPGAPVPVIEFTLQPRGELQAADYQTGAFSTDDFRASKGFDPEADGKGARYYVAPTPQAPPGGAGSGGPFSPTPTLPASSTSTPTTMVRSPTSSPSTHPLRASLSRP